MSARDRNFGLAMRERERRVAGLLDDPYDTTAGAAISDPAGNAFWGSLRELGQRYKGGARIDLSGIGRNGGEDAGLYGGLNPLERSALKDKARADAFDASVTGAQTERLAQDAFTNARRDQLVGDLKQAENERAVNEAFALPERGSITTETTGPNGKTSYAIRPTEAETDRERVLARLPPALRPVYQAQWAAQDAAATKAQGDLLKGQADVIAAKGKAAQDTPFQPRVDATGKPVTGAAALDGLPESVRNTVQAVLDGRQQLPTGTATKDPYWKGIIGLANQADPNFDAVNYNARANTRKDFTSGKAAGQINAINTVVGHLHDLAAEGDKLGNTSLNWVNRVYNALTPGGSEKGVTINNFNTLKEGVGTELMRVWRQVGAGSEKEIEDWKSTISDAKSPEELRGAFKTIGGMLESKLDSLDQQYKQGMGTDKVSAISPESRQRLDALQGIKSGGKGGTVTLVSPDGKETMDVPADQVEHYLGLGAKRK